MQVGVSSPTPQARLTHPALPGAVADGCGGHQPDAAWNSQGPCCPGRQASLKQRSTTNRGVSSNSSAKELALPAVR